MKQKNKEISARQVEAESFQPTKRILRKPPFVRPALLEEVDRAIANNLNSIRTYERGSTIIPKFIGMKFEVHNGKVFKEVLINEDMLGYKLGDFSPTRTFRGHGGKKNAMLQKQKKAGKK